MSQYARAHPDDFEERWEDAVATQDTRTYGLYDERWKAYRALKWHDNPNFWVAQTEDGTWAVYG